MTVTLNQSEQEQLSQFLEVFLRKTKSDTIVNASKIVADTTTFDKIYKELKTLIDNNATENSIGKFLRNKIYLIDSKYVKTIPELNVVLASARKPDFALIDYNHYIDIFEIKRPDTKILYHKQDRNNYFFHPDLVKAITQAEKYLFHAERKAANLVDEIPFEKGHNFQNLEFVRPSVYLLSGHSKQLTNIAMKRDFQILRKSLKNIEIILYDEILERLKLQKKRFTKSSS